MIILIILFIIFITVITGRLLLHNSTFGSFNKTLSIKFSISYFIGSSFYIITLTSYFFIFKNLELSNLFTILSALLLFFKRRKELLKIFFENFNLNYKIIFYNILIFVFLSIFIFSVWAIPYENLDNKLLSIGSLHSAKYAWLANYIQTCSIIPVTGNNFGQSILAYFIGLFFSAKPHLYLYIWLVISMYFLILFIYGFINFYFGAGEGKKNIQIYCVLGTVCFLFGGTALSFTHILVIDSNNPFIINGYTHTIFGIFFIFFGYILFIKIKEGKNLNLQNIFIIFIFLGANYFMSPENIIFFAGLLFFVFFTKSIMRNQKIKLAILLIISIIYFIPQGGMLTPIKLQENFSNEAILSFFQDRSSNQYGKLNLSIVPGYMFQYDGLSYSKWKNGQEENTKKIQYLKEKIKKDFFSNFNILLWQLEKILIDSFVVLFFPIAGLYLFRLSETTQRAMEDQVTKNIMQDQNLMGPKMPTNEYDSALATVDMEARKDKSGNVMVYNLPSGDMGGSYEVAGINDKYHPAAAEMLKNLPAGERRDAAARYVVEYTKPFTSKLPEPYRPFFQDLAFNRGVGGATKFLQRAVGVKDDGALGPQTLKALEGLNPSEVMKNVSVEQMTYERRLAEQNPERKKFLNGLQNRVSNRYRLFGNAPTG
jgi:hypothetical protein